MSLQEVRVYRVRPVGATEGGYYLHDLDLALEIVGITKRFQENNGLPVEKMAIKSELRQEWVSDFVPDNLPKYIHTTKEQMKNADTSEDD